MRAIPSAVLILLCTCASRANAQDARSGTVPYHVEAHIELGPMASDFLRGRPLPQGASRTTMGYDAIVRLMWHPDHLLAVGLLSGYQLLVAENYVVPDSLSSGSVHASLHAMPVMFDVSMQVRSLEVGVGLGGYILTTMLDDLTTARASRFELGTIFHAAYHWRLQDHLSLGAEALVSYMAYRGILAIAPQLDIEYDLLTY